VFWTTGNIRGKGVPANVSVSTTTPLNIFQARDVTGYLNISNGAKVVQGNNDFIVQGNFINDGTYSFVNDGSKPLTVKGNFTNSSTGSTTLSASSGGDLKLQGNLIDNGTFVANTRAIFFTGTGHQEISGSGRFNINYLVTNKVSR